MTSRRPAATGARLRSAGDLGNRAGAWHRQNAYLPILPGLVLFGVALALILTVNDPVSLDTLPSVDQGQASGVSATAEQFGGAIGIAGLYLVFHTSYLNRLVASISSSSLPSFTASQAERLKSALLAAEQTGLRPNSFDPTLAALPPARTISLRPRLHRRDPDRQRPGGRRVSAHGMAGQETNQHG